MRPMNPVKVTHAELGSHRSTQDRLPTGLHPFWEVDRRETPGLAEAQPHSWAFLPIRASGLECMKGRSTISALVSCETET